MAYVVLYGDQILYDPYTDDIIYDAKLTDQVNALSFFDFSIAPTHHLANKIAEKADLVRVYADKKILFEGYIESIEQSIEGLRSVSCTSVLAYLDDTLVRPYSTLEGEAPLQPPSSVDGYFQWLIDQHNEHVLSPDRTFDVGVNQGSALDKNNYIFRESSQCPTTSDEIRSKIIDSLGGYLLLRFENERRVLDLYADAHEANTQIMDFGENITDFTKTITVDGQYTAVRPVGGTPEATDENDNPQEITIESLEDGGTSDPDIVKWKDVIYSVSGVARYGYKEMLWNNSDIVTPKGLLDASIVALRKLLSPILTLDIKAVDMALFMDGYEHLICGQAVRVRSRPHGVDEYLLVNEIDLDLQNPENTTYILGASYDSLTGQQSGFLKSLNANINASFDAVDRLTTEVKDTAIKVDHSIVSQEVQFYQSSSPTELKDGEWKNDNKFVEGRYTWTRTLVTYADGTDEYQPDATGVCITGNTGEEGKPSYLHIAYADSEDGSEGFSITDSLGKLYIGQYTDFEFTPSTDPSKYTWTKIKGDAGPQGPQGATGTSVVAIASRYLASSLDSGVTIQTPGWTTEVQSIDENNPYLWTYSSTEFSNGLVTNTIPIIIGTYGPQGPQGPAGEPGTPGEDGKGILTVVDEWYVSTSDAEPEGGSWSTDMPELPPGKYLWHRQKITWSDWSVTYTNSTVSQWVSKTEFQQTTDAINIKAESALTKVDNLDVPGTNLLLESSTLNREESSETYKIAQYNIAKELELDQIYTISANVTNSGRVKLAFYIGDDVLISDWITLSEGVQTLSTTFIATQAMIDADNKVVIYASSVEGDQGESPISGTCIVHWAKLEKGDSATEWSAAPQDDAIIYTRLSKLEITSQGLEVLVGEVSTKADNAQTTADGNQQAITNVIDGITETIDAKTDHIITEMNEKMNLESISGGWFRQTVEGGNPVLRMGATGNDLNVALSNAELAFYNGSQKLAYANGNAFAAPNMRVDSSLSMGRYVWIPGANGHLTLRYS